MTNSSNRLATVGVLAVTLLATQAFAEPPAAGGPPGPAKAAAPQAEKAANQAARPAEKAEGKPEKAADKAEPKAERAADRAAKGEEKAAAAQERKEFRNELRALRDEFKGGKVTKDQIKERLAKLKSTVAERRTERRKALHQRWGATLAHPSVVQELRHHARRVAFLNRALLLAETERTGKDKDKLVDRIEKLIDKENERHEKAMERLKSTPPAPGTGNTVNAGAPAQPGSATAPAAVNPPGANPAAPNPPSANPATPNPPKAEPKGGTP